MPVRVGLVVPSSNTTMETELPALLGRSAGPAPAEFTFHSSRMRMRSVTKEELGQMDQDAERCALEVSDAGCDVVVYACLVAVMCQGWCYHEVVEGRLAEVVRGNGGPRPVVSSAGALLRGLDVLGAKRVAIITPYVRSLTDEVVGYLGAGGVEVTDALSLEVPDNRAVGRLDPMALVDHARRLDASTADAIVLSACVQMPSLAAIPRVEEELGLPVLTAATSSAYCLLDALGLEPSIPNAGVLLAGTGR